METFFSLSIGQMFALLGAALASILPGIGSAKGVGMAGEASAGVVTENPALSGKLLVLQALPGTQGIYGLIIAFIVILKTNMFGGMIELTALQGLNVLMSCLPIAVVGLISAVYQARVSSAAIVMTGVRPEASGKGIVMAILVETYAILALLASFLLVWYVI